MKKTTTKKNTTIIKDDLIHSHMNSAVHHMIISHRNRRLSKFSIITPDTVNRKKSKQRTECHVSCL